MDIVNILCKTTHTKLENKRLNTYTYCSQWIWCFIPRLVIFLQTITFILDEYSEEPGEEVAEDIQGVQLQPQELLDGEQVLAITRI